MLVLDTWSKASNTYKVRRSPPAGSWRSTPFSSVPANGSDSSSASGFDISDSSSAAARSYYSLMNHRPTDGIYDPVHSHQADPNVMQMWTDKPRLSSPHAYGGVQQQHHEHQDPWRQQQHEQQHQQQSRIFVPRPSAGASNEEYARWQALQSVMAALEHSAGVCVCPSTFCVKDSLWGCIIALSSFSVVCGMMGLATFVAQGDFGLVV